MYVCQSVSWLTFLLKLDKYRDISSSVWDIFLKYFGGIPGMFVHLIQIILNFMYVCQSVSWLSFLLKLYKYGDISSSVWDIFLKFFGGILLMFVHLYVRTSPLTSLVYNSVSGWDIFLKSFGDIPGMFVDYFWIILNFLYVCQSVIWLTSLLKIG